MDIQTPPLFLAREGVFRARIDDGLGLKACESWLSLSRSPPPRICLIVGTNLETSIYILDVGGGRCGGDSVEPRPILRIPRSFRDVRFCVVDSILYVLKIRRQRRWNPVTDHDDVYSFRLSENFSDVVLEDNMLEKLPILLSPKENALPLQFGNCVLFFSTRIRFYDRVDSPTRKLTCDFELYDPIHNAVTKLPQLWIRPQNTSRYCQTFQLFRPNSTWEDFLISTSHSHSKSSSFPYSFTIDSYAFRGDLFFIQTDFGRLFSIDLLDPRLAEWRLMDKDLQFRGRDRNFITGDGRLCIDAFGVYRLEGVKHKFKSGVEFPLSYFPSISRSVTLLDPCTPCIVRATIDPSYYDDCYEFYTTPCWCVDVFEVDLPKLLADGDDKDEDGEKKEYMKHTVTFKLCIENQKVNSIYVDSLFPF